MAIRAAVRRAAARSGTQASSLASLAERLLTPHGVDRYLELIDPMLVRREIRGEVVALRRPTRDSITLTVRPSRAWQGFAAGQFVRVTVDIDGVRRTRCYSPAGSAHRDGELEFTVKAHEGGLVSRHLHEHGHVGMVLGLSHADGTFALPEQRPDSIVLIAGGSGITPVLSMLRTLVDERYPGEVSLLYYARTPADMPYAEELDELASRRGVRIHVRHTAADGHFTADHLRRVAPWFARATTYLCGPPPLMEAVRTLYADAGIAGQLHTEEFTPPVLTVAASEAGGRIRFTRSGVDVANDGRTLLEQAEDAGLSPDHGCRMGICFSCTQRKVSGVVRTASGGESAEDDEEIQLCVTAAAGDVDIDC
ncbi:Ferredoxin-NADP reductase [Prauserella aidingensis]|uniref:ferredoxin reductase n=1 Tax=Prauserella aidingensis TaxID=387890 RepID=UPI0020A5C418|nr:ferredoxin reductase [Prauserella aidingensis]MCP2254047.1 Ferredoxin-NADP reductase [Prauserella aidingensis]